MQWPDHFAVMFNASCSVYDKVGLQASDIVLDLGCGDGRWLLAAARRGCKGRGLDLNEDLLQRGRLAAAEAGVSAASIVDLPRKCASKEFSVKEFLSAGCC